MSRTRYNRLASHFIGALGVVRAEALANELDCDHEGPLADFVVDLREACDESRDEATSESGF